jgi:hypothetical protein
MAVPESGNRIYQIANPFLKWWSPGLRASYNQKETDHQNKLNQKK